MNNDGGPGGALRQMDNHEAYNIIDELTKEGKIESRGAEEAKEKFYRLHEALVQNMENEQVLMKKARALQKELSNELLKLEKTQQQQAENEALLKELNNQVIEVKKEIDDINERRDRLKTEKNQLDLQKQDIKLELQMREQAERDRLIPEIERFKKLIEEQHQGIVDNDLAIEQENQNNLQLKEKIQQLEQVKESKKEEYEKEQAKYLAEKDEPIRLGKGNENIKIAVNHLKSELEGLIREALDYDNNFKKESEQQKTNSDLIAEKHMQLNQLNSRYTETNQNINKKDERIKQLEQEKKNIIERDYNVTTDTKAKIMEKKRHQEKLNRLNKRIDESMKKYKQIEYENTNIEGNIKELESILSGTTKLKQEKESQEKELEKEQKKLMDEQHIFVGQLVKKGLDDKKAEAEKTKLEKDISAHKQQVLEFLEEENKLVIEIKFLSTIREKMARTASQAMAQARETKEELKVKELLILDLTKKQQETEFRLNSFIALYEEVKNARNKYVSQIQSSSQDLAEMKERIKILQNEVEILRNESSEKDRVLAECKKNVQIEVQKRDQLRAELNKKEFTYKNKMSIIGQRINEGDKHNLIINSLQKEMNNLIFKYEQACDSRNYMGIQLIDKNDELCILYEKSNIQENILKNGEQLIRQKEEEIRMINLELKERQRQLEVIRKQIPEVPDLAQQVIELKKKLDSEKQKVEMLASQLEDPYNHPNKTELIGEDADPEALQAKIQVLEERLNNKKESLLEKELVYEEVTNLAEKLRTKALDGRKSTLEIAEKINEYKARTTDLSRKMLATVSELSMFQSKALKLQQEKEEKETLLEQAVQRMENGMPPTDTADAEWEKKIRDQSRKEQDRLERMQRKQLEMSLPQNGVKTTAFPRPNSYMPPDIQIPKPYGHFQPFKPTEPGANMRHIVKPKPIEIEY